MNDHSSRSSPKLGETERPSLLLAVDSLGRAAGSDRPKHGDAINVVVVDINLAELVAPRAGERSPGGFVLSACTPPLITESIAAFCRGEAGERCSSIMVCVIFFAKTFGEFTQETRGASCGPTKELTFCPFQTTSGNWREGVKLRNRAKPPNAAVPSVTSASKSLSKRCASAVADRPQTHGSKQPTGWQLHWAKWLAPVVPETKPPSELTLCVVVTT